MRLIKLVVNTFSVGSLRVPAGYSALSKSNSITAVTKTKGALLLLGFDYIQSRFRNENSKPPHTNLEQFKKVFLQLHLRHVLHVGDEFLKVGTD